MNKIIYLDAAASALKSPAVIDAEMDFLSRRYANAGRGVCARAAAVDDMVNDARNAVADFIGASADQVVFVGGATDGLNRVLNILRVTPGVWRAGLRVAVSDLDHHSARLPWVAAAARGWCQIVQMPLNADLDIDVAAIGRADVYVISAMSNVLGRAQDVAAIVRAARAQNPDAITIVDAAQYVAHRRIDARAWGADFIIFSAHKIGADAGLGVMYMRTPDRWSPDKFGGGMVLRVDGDDISLHDAPYRFEAGTLPLTALAGLRVAIDQWRAWNGGGALVRDMHAGLANVGRIRLYTGADAAMVTFSVADMHSLDVGARAGVAGLCMRVGNMCASWAMRAIGAPDGGVCRLSVGPWNTDDDARRAVEIIRDIVK